MLPSINVVSKQPFEASTIRLENISASFFHILILTPNYVSGGFLFLFPFCVADTVDHVDDGIGTSDDETNSNSSTQSPETSESSSSPNMGQSRRVIKLDLAAISQLLAFDEVSRMMDRTVRRAAREKNKTSALFGFRKLFRPISTFFVKASLKSGRGTHFGKSSETANDRDSAHKMFRQKGRVVTQKGRWVHRPDLFFTAGQYLFSLRLRSSRELNLPKDDFHLRKKSSIAMCISNGFSSFNRRKIMIAFIILKVRRPFAFETLNNAL